MLREAYEIDSYVEHLTAAGWLTAPQMAELFDVHPVTPSASRAKACCAPCALTTEARYSWNRRPERYPSPIRGDGYATGGNTQSLYRMGEGA